MLGWRRRKDGFEWREYVRTTILVRRKNRRDRIVRAGHAAVDGLKVAGERGAAAGAVGAQAVGRAAKVAGRQGMAVGAAGAQALGRGAKVASHQGLAMSLAGWRAADNKVRASIPVIWEATQLAVHKILSALATAGSLAAAGVLRLAEISAPHAVAMWDRLQPLFATLRRRNVSLVLALVAGVALVGSFRRMAANGISTEIVVALVLGFVIACALVAAWLADPPNLLAAAMRGTGRGIARCVGAIGRTASGHGPSRSALARSGAIFVVLTLLVGAGWLAWRAAAALPSLMTDASATLEGRAVAVSGDALRVARTTVALSGIEAPVDGQTCESEGARSWRCDTAAKIALAHLLRSGAVTCELSGSDDQGRRIGTCREGQTDIAAELVRNGNVFAETGFFSSYGSLENEARETKVGIWRGEAKRPSDYRAQKWEEAKRESPEGCPIKGNVTRGRRIYVLPWAQGYERVKISSRRGERWFCSEDEAIAAGWKPSEQS
jgi:endonuclease YncB( thermonuclease family)